MRTPLPTWRKIWLWYLVSTGSSSPKKTKTAPRASARGVRISRSHSSRHRFIRGRARRAVAGAISRSLGTGAGEGQERGFQVGGARLAGDLAGAAGGEGRGDAALARLDAGGVDPDGVGAGRFDLGRPRPAGHGG